eukprot:SAG11_NODE_2003_length_3938_cov_1.717895_3_plen_312_part_00
MHLAVQDPVSIAWQSQFSNKKKELFRQNKRNGPAPCQLCRGTGRRDLGHTWGAAPFAMRRILFIEAIPECAPACVRKTAAERGAPRHHASKRRRAKEHWAADARARSPPPSPPRRRGAPRTCGEPATSCESSAWLSSRCVLKPTPVVPSSGTSIVRRRVGFPAGGRNHATPVASQRCPPIMTTGMGTFVTAAASACRTALGAVAISALRVQHGGTGGKAGVLHTAAGAVDAQSHFTGELLAPEAAQPAACPRPCAATHRRSRIGMATTVSFSIRTFGCAQLPTTRLDVSVRRPRYMSGESAPFPAFHVAPG